jgi:hypothetical protein
MRLFTVEIFTVEIFTVEIFTVEMGVPKIALTGSSTGTRWTPSLLAR